MRALLLMAVLFFQQHPAAPPTGTISGRLLDWDRSAVAGTLVLARPAVMTPGVTFHQAFTDPSGAFRFEGVVPGSYHIVTDSIYYPGVADRDTARVVTITAESLAVGGLEFVLPVPPPGVLVTGRVIVPENTILAEEQRVLRLVGGRPYRSTTAAIAADGSFELRNVLPGDYSLQLLSIVAMEGVEITVEDRDVTGVELRVPRFATVLGAVAVEGRAARPRLSVAFDGPMPERLSGTQTRPDGTFEMRLIEGEYRTVVHNLPAGYYVKSLTAGSVNLLTQPLKADAASPAGRVVVTLAMSPGVKVSGQVKAGAEGLPDYASRRITLAAAAAHTSVSAPVNADGSFELDKVMPGTYVARVSLDASVSSPPIVIAIPDKDTKDLDVTIPPLIEVFGRVAVDGNGPAPHFSLLLRGTGLNLKSEREDRLPSVERSSLDRLADSGAAQVIRIEVEPRPDGTFKMMLPEGVYRLATDEKSDRWGSRLGVPDPFFIRSLNYGSARLFTEPMPVTASERAELHVGFGTNLPNPWVRVSGRVTGLSSSQGPFRVSLQGGVLAMLETPVNPDGTFEFPMVLAGQEYTANLVPTNDAATVASVHAATKDVKGVEIVVPPEREITMRATVEGGGAVPGFQLNLESVPCNPFCPSSMSMIVKPDRDGTLKVKLPEDERSVTVDGLPFGYSVQSLTYGATNLRKGRLKLAGSESRELEVKFEIDPDLPTGGVRGRVTGLDPDSPHVQLVLHGVAFVSSFEVPVSPDGSFAFSKIPQGTYTPTLTGDVVSGLLTPSAIVVAGKDLIGVEIAAPSRSARPQRPTVEAVLTGTEISELGRASSEGASESAAVSNLRTINTAQVTYLSVSNGNYGTLQNLIDSGLLDESFLRTKAGYAFSIVASGAEYNATAVPAAGGRFGFYSTPDAVVRYSLAPILSPPRQGGKPYLR